MPGVACLALRAWRVPAGPAVALLVRMMSAAGAPAAPGGARVPAPAPSQHAKHTDVARSWDTVLPGSCSAVRVVVGRPLEDCMSYFIGTLVFPVRTAREAQDGVAMVRELQLLAGADHFIAAFHAADGSCFQDDGGEEDGGEEDGGVECGGAATLAAVLSHERVVGCVVVVARWLHRVVLDQERIFTHIEQRARLLLQAVGQRRGDTMTLEDNTVGAGAPEPEASSSGEGAAGAEGVVDTAGAAGAAEDSSGSYSDGFSYEDEEELRGDDWDAKDMGKVLPRNLAEASAWRDMTGQTLPSYNEAVLVARLNEARRNKGFLNKYSGSALDLQRCGWSTRSAEAAPPRPTRSGRGEQCFCRGSCHDSVLEL